MADEQPTRPERLVVPISSSEKLAEAAARAILRDISAQQLAPGTALPPEAAMLERYGVARATLREALRILEFNGLVSMRRGARGGPVVAEPTARDLGRVATLHFEAMGVRYEHLIDAREKLEPLMARLAASCTDDDAIDRLRKVLEISERPAAAAETLRTAVDFHACIADMSGNPVLGHLSAALQTIGHRFDERPSREVRDQIAADHLAIGHAVLAGDAASAERLMTEHLSRSLDYGNVPRSVLRHRIEWR